MKTILVGPAAILFSVLISVSVYAENECEKKSGKPAEENKKCAQPEPAAASAKDEPRKMSEPEQKAMTVKELAEKRMREYEQWEKENKVPNAQID